MKRHPAEDQPTEPAEETTGEYEEPSSRNRVVALFVVGLVAAWRIVAAFPEVAYTIVGVLGTLGWQRATAWREGRHGDEEREAETLPPDVGEALRRLVGDDNGVLLTRLRNDLRLRDTKVVKQLLDADGIKWKGVRTSHGNGPGVHVKDIPPAPSPVADPHSEGCCCRSGDNTNGNNAPGEGIRVERTEGGLVIYDLADTHRHRKVGDH